MRRIRGIVAATIFLLLGTFLFFAQDQFELPVVEIRIQHGKSHTEDKESPASLKDVPQSELEPPRGSIQHVASPPDVPLPLSEALPTASERPALDDIHAPDLPATGEVPLPLPLPTGPGGNTPASDDIPRLPVEEEIPLPAAPESTAPAFEAEFAFQQDLDLDLPIEIFKSASNNSPHNYSPNGPKTFAYATFMATRNPSLKDPYFMAIHSLIYRVLWAPRSRTQTLPFVVFVADFVTPEQRQLLSGAGAVVRELAPLEWNPNVEGVQHRWKDLFAKLNMWNETEFSRIHFLDADAFPTTNVDDVFDIAPVQDCDDAKLQPDDVLPDGSKVCEPYVFAGVPQDPFNATDININVGSMVFTPSERMHQRLLQNYVKTDSYNCLMAEQAFLNWQFNPNGAFPATRLEREYGGFFPQDDEEGKLKVVHEKLWSEERPWLKKEWEEQWEEMLAFYNSSEFLEQRKADGSIF